MMRCHTITTKSHWELWRIVTSFIFKVSKRHEFEFKERKSNVVTIWLYRIHRKRTLNFTLKLQSGLFRMHTDMKLNNKGEFLTLSIVSMKIKFKEKKYDTAELSLQHSPHHNLYKLMSAFTTTAAVYPFTSLISSRVQQRYEPKKEFISTCWLLLFQDSLSALFQIVLCNIHRSILLICHTPSSIFVCVHATLHIHTLSQRRGAVARTLINAADA
jgi:hypothetical protein